MREPTRTASLAAAILLALMTAVHYQVIFQGRSLVHTNFSNPLDWRPLPQNYGHDMIPHDEWTRRGQWPFPNLRDPGATWWQWEPSTEFLKQAIADREWPFWDPYVAAGTPAMANLVQAFFFPPYLVLVALGASVGLKNVYFLSLLWGASFVTYLFLRRHGLQFLPSLGGAIVILLSGTMNQNLGAFAGQTIACLPATLLVTRLLLDRPEKGRAAALALVYASTALASFPPLLLAIFGLTALYAVVAIVTGDVDHRARAWWWWAGATLVSVMLVAAYYLPAFALRAAAPQVAAIYHGAGLETMPFVKAFQLLSPTIMGGVPIYWNDPLVSPTAAHIPYVGMVALVGALLSRPWDARSRVLFATSVVAAAAILLKLFGVPPVQWIGHLPFFTEIHFSHYFGVPLAFPSAFLAALGLDRLIRGGVNGLWACAAGAAGLVAVGGGWQAAARAGVFQGPTAAVWTHDWRFLAIIAFAAAVATVTAALTTAPRLRTTLVGCLLALAATEGIYNNSYLKPKRWNLFAEPVPYVRVLQEQALGRVFPFGVPAANVNEAFKISSLDSLMAFNAPRVHALYHQYAAPPKEVFLRAASRIPPDPVLDRAGITSIGLYDALTDQMRDARQRGYQPRFSDGFFTIFDRPPTPRFRFSSTYRVVSTDAALAAIASAPSDEIILETVPPLPSAPAAPGDPDVRVDGYHRNSVVLTVDAPRPGLVYAAESLFDGWSATVNGQRVPILAANYAFRAVAVPAGVARVEFHYWPPGLTAGLVISMAGVTLLAVMLLRRW